MQPKDEYYNTLLKNARKNGDEDLDILFVAFKPLVSKLARKYFLTDRDEADLIQEGMIGLYKAYLSYDESQDISFFTYAYTCIYRKIVSAVRNSLNQKNAPLNSYVSLSGMYDNEEDNNYFVVPSSDLMPDELYEIQEEQKRFQDTVKSLLSKFEIEVLNLYLSGKSYKDIAKSLDKNEKSVDNAIMRIKNKLKVLEK